MVAPYNGPMSPSGKVILGAGMTFAAITISYGVLASVGELRETKREYDRMTPLLEQVAKTATGEDNYFSSKEQADFLREMGYNKMITEGEPVSFGITGKGTPYVHIRKNIGVERVPVTEKMFRDYVDRRKN